jgi:hypothetical protein
MLTAYYTSILLPKFRILNNVPYTVHKCCQQCVELAEEDFVIDKIHTNPFVVPFVCQWTIVDGKPRGYRTPCRRTLYSLEDIEQYLFRTESKLSIKFFVDDLSTRFTPPTDTYEKKFIIIDDLSNGLEMIKVPVYNDINNDRPDHFTYVTQIRPIDYRIQAALNDTNMTTCCNCTDK